MGISESDFIALQDKMRRNGAPSLEECDWKGVMALSPERPAADILEAPIQMECTRILESDGWRALRTDPVSDRGRGKGFGEVGMADYLYIRYWTRGTRVPQTHDQRVNAAHLCSGNETMWVEFKRGRGGVLSKSQRAWHTKERARGALTLIAGEDFLPSVHGFRDWYRNSGLQRRRDL